MKPVIPFLLSLFISTFIFAQTFEGKLTSKNTYKSKLPNVTDQQFTTMMGDTQEYYIKDGNYKSVVNGALLKWQLYVNADNKLYTQMANADAALWNDGSVNTDVVLKAELNKDAIEVLGFKCNELVLTCKSGIQKYYYNSDISVDPKAYQNHKFGNWFEVVSRTKALPLKFIIENAQFIMENVATEIKPMTLDATFFTLPSELKTMKSPY